MSPARSPREPVRSRPLLYLMFASLAVGVVLMLIFHAPLTRIVGVAALFTFIVSGVFLIADPAFLVAEEDQEAFSEREPG